MASPSDRLLSQNGRSDWVRLRTLMFLRWMAILGQIAAITIAERYFTFQLPLGACYLAVGASIIANMVSSFIFPENKRLSQTQAMMMLLFDLAQLSFLLYLTGGLSNPFALLILAPVTISASALELRTTVFLGVVSILLITLVWIFNLPLMHDDGSTLVVPEIFEFGFWLSIVIGILFLGLYTRRVSSEIQSMSNALLATQMALAREQKLTDLGGVVAAAAHELGTPLATIKLVSTEMIDALEGEEDLQDDARLIREQADRCRDILRSMGRVGKEDLHMQTVSFETLVREAAEPHQTRGKDVLFNFGPGPGGAERQPNIHRHPEVIHGLRNLIQNAVDFADSKVWIDGEWTEDYITLRICDDGEGYPSHLIGRIGDPFVRSRRSEQDLARRPEYEGMGLGLFIAKTLLERTGAELTFANGSNPFLSAQERPERSGAIILLKWPAERMVHSPTQGLGENKPIEV